MTDRNAFYLARDSRTLQYGVPDIFEAPVAVIVGPQAANSTRGQLATMALVNLLARIHRRLRLKIPAVSILRPSVVPASQLDEAAFQLAQTIDPFIDLGTDVSEAAAVIGLGADAPPGLPWYAGSCRQIGTVDRSPVSFDHGDSP